MSHMCVCYKQTSEKPTERGGVGQGGTEWSKVELDGVGSTEVRRGEVR